MKKLLFISVVILLQFKISAQSLINYIPNNSTGVLKFSPSKIDDKYSLDSVKNWLMGADYSFKNQLFNSYFDIRNIDLAFLFDKEIKTYYTGDVYNYFQLNENFKIEAIVFEIEENKLAAFKNYLNSNSTLVYNKKTVFVFKNNANKQFGIYFDANIATVFKLNLVDNSSLDSDENGYSYEEKELRNLKNELSFYKIYGKQLLKKSYSKLDENVVNYLSSNKDDIVLFSNNFGEILNQKLPFKLTHFNKELIDQRYLIGLNFSEGELSVDFELYNPVFWNRYNNLLSPIELDEKMFEFISDEALLIQTSNINTQKSYNLLYNHLLPLIMDASIELNTGINGVGAYTQWMMQFFDSKKLANMFTGHSVTAYLPSKSITKMVEVVSYDENFNEVVKNEEQEILIPSFTTVTGLNEDNMMKSFFEIGTNVFEEFTVDNGIYILDIKSLIKRFDNSFNFDELKINEKYFVKFYDGYMITSTDKQGVFKVDKNLVLSEENKDLMKEYPYLLSIDMNKIFDEILRYKIVPEMYNGLVTSVLSKTETLNFGIKTSDDKMSLRLFLKMKSKKNALITINEMFKLLRP